jgi:hypothetical protein
MYHSMNMEPHDSLLAHTEQETEQVKQEIPDNKEEAEASMNPSQHFLRAWKETDISSAASLMFHSP